VTSASMCFLAKSFVSRLIFSRCCYSILGFFFFSSFFSCLFPRRYFCRFLLHFLQIFCLFVFHLFLDIISIFFVCLFLAMVSLWTVVVFFPRFFFLAASIRFFPPLVRIFFFLLPALAGPPLPASPIAHFSLHRGLWWLWPALLNRGLPTVTSATLPLPVRPVLLSRFFSFDGSTSAALRRLSLRLSAFFFFSDFVHGHLIPAYLWFEPPW